LSASSRARTRKSLGGTTTPFSPWIGSITTAATVSSSASARALASPYGTKVTSPGSGSNGLRYAGFQVSARAALVRPWKAPSMAISRVRPGAMASTAWTLRVTLNAASLASVPELVRKTRAGVPGSALRTARAASRSPSRICGGVAKKFET